MYLSLHFSSAQRQRHSYMGYLLTVRQKICFKYASKGSAMVRPNRNVQADKALQRQLISHQLCWGPVWARLRSTDRETDGTGLAGGVSTVLSARIRAQTSVCIITHISTDCVRELAAACARSPVSLCIFEHRLVLHTPADAPGYASRGSPDCFLSPS